MDFIDNPSLAYSGTSFVEAGANDGSITTTRTITLSLDTYTGALNDDFVADGKATVASVPAGLTVVLNRDSATVITMSLTGNATAHQNVNDIAILDVTFLDTAFTGSTGSVDVLGEHG